MSRLEVPLLSKTVWATGEILLRAELDLLIRDDNGVLSFPTAQAGGFPVHPAHQRARASCSRLPVQAGLVRHRALRPVRAPCGTRGLEVSNRCPSRGALRPSRAAPGGQPFPEGL